MNRPVYNTTKRVKCKSVCAGYKVIQHENGKWYVHQGKKYFNNGFDQCVDAYGDALKRYGHALINALDAVQASLEVDRQVPDNDPFGWRA